MQIICSGACVKATGGSGNYSWESENVTVATVSTRGEIRTEEATGETLVTVSDARNNLHFDTMKVTHSVLNFSK